MKSSRTIQNAMTAETGQSAPKENTRKVSHCLMNQYEDLVQNANIIVLRIDKDGFITFFNAFAGETFGFSGDEIIGKSVIDTIIPKTGNYARYFRKMIRQLLSHPDEYVTQEIENTCLNGERVWVEWRYYAISNNSGQVVEIACFGKDISRRKLAEQALLENERTAQALLNVTSESAIMIDLTGKILLINEIAAQRLGKTAKELTGKNLQDLMPPEIKDARKKQVLDVIRTKKAVRFQDMRSDYYFDTMVYPILDEQGNVCRVAVFARDITEQKRKEEVLRFQKTLLESQTEASIDGILVVSGNGKLISANKRFTEMWKIPRRIIDDGSREKAEQLLYKKMADSGMVTGRLDHLRKHCEESDRFEIELKDGRVFDSYTAPVMNQEGDCYGRVWFYRDITSQKLHEKALEDETEHRKAHERELEKLTRNLEEANKKLHEISIRDGLTGIPNRRFFDDVYQTEWRRAARDKEPVSLLMIDIDYFKRFNDTYGHLRGDECLREVARAIEQTVNRSGDFVARYGGEEFVVLLPGTKEKGAQKVAEAIQSRLRDMAIEHQESDIGKFVTVSIGISVVFPGRVTDPVSLIKASDDALYDAKSHGRNLIRTKLMD
ncbi:diguanylate cyclase [bacterium]|nr:diguanylate cyclase [bacterium]